MRIVFSSLSSLIDPIRVSYGAVRPALKALERRSIPLILFTSRTLSEVQEIREQLHLDHPFVVEDGAALYVPADYFPASILDDSWLPQHEFQVKICGEERQALKPVLQHLRRSLHADLVSVTDWTEQELAVMLGIPVTAARQAQQRFYSEIFLYSGDPQALYTAAQTYAWTRDPLVLRRCAPPMPPHYWILTAHHALAVPTLLRCYQQHLADVLSLGIAWNPQDIDFVPYLDQVVILPGHHQPDLWNQHKARWLRADLPPPEGWNEAVLTWLESTDHHEEWHHDP